VWVESPTNPMLDVVDLAAVIGIARAAGAVVVVDNTFATPLARRRWRSAPTPFSTPQRS